MRLFHGFSNTFSERFDHALFRRLKCQIHVPMPGEEERFALLSYYLRSFDNITPDQLMELAKDSEWLSSSDISGAAENILNRFYLQHYNDQLEKIGSNITLQPASFEEILNILIHTTPTNKVPDIKSMQRYADQNKNAILDVIEAIELEEKPIEKRSLLLEFCTCS